MPDQILIISRVQAQAQGLKRFYTGVPCKHGHIAERWVRDGKCIKCLYARHQKWLEVPANRQKVYDGIARWARHNSEKRKISHARWRQRIGQTAMRELWRNIRNKRIDKARASYREYYYSNTVKRAAQNLQWWRDHPEKRRLKDKLREYRECSPPWVNKSALQAIYDACPDDHTVDHIVPIKGITIEGYRVSGLHVPWNLQYMSHSENSRKKNRMRPEDQTLCETYTSTT